ncbi:cytochrome c oxidase subunit 3 [Agriterribacter sp.]|uniref:cytochrome c oxidase subunit 3 n=1 Tax=Agriterribacter sp. TaxID=2821509 RepID=UPI002BE91746|nr:cytochrome c oxidase subunit 3 [Agriterribacter sp.]HRO45377.1 cytochrome c oxidase subunit 3 [Agriterribacter sp.]HRQ16931.1 cytochrome c oxidase subunit 3 [Agriterribacter sp.]
MSTHIPAGYKWWTGGKSPYNVSYGKLMMWIFLLSDTFTFGALLIAYGTIRVSHDYWPDPNHVFNTFPLMGDANLPLAFVSLMTFILIMSSVTMVLAVHEGHKRNKKGVEKWLLWTILGGFLFLGCQAWEWTHLITHTHPVLIDGKIQEIGATIKENHFGPIVSGLFHNGHQVTLPGPVAFGNSFFGITGFHGFHVSIGVFLNILMYFWTLNGRFTRLGHYEMVEKVGLYWHFVDLVWVFVFLCFYLI